MVVASALEVINALVLSYLASEYLLKEQLKFERSKQGQSRIQGLWVVWIVANVLFFSIKAIWHGIFETHVQDLDKNEEHAINYYLHIPKEALYVVVPSAFLALTWWDIKRLKADVTLSTFCVQLSLSTVECFLLLPVIAVLVALCFLILVGLLDLVHTSTAWLDNPIYYGVLYGPFSTIYFFTKRRCVRNKGSVLPL